MQDNETKIEDMKTLLREFAHERDWQQFHTPKDLAIAISTEAAELLEHYRFRNGEDLVKYLNENKQQVSHECADILAFLVRLADVSGIDLAKALHEKMEKNRKRFPIEESSGKKWMKK